MQRWGAFRQLVLARLREFYREPAAIFWVYGFPVILAVGLGIAFWNRPPEEPQVDVVASEAAVPLAQYLASAGMKIETHDLEACRQRYRVGRTTLYVAYDGTTATFGLDATRSESLSARHHVESAIRKWKTPDALATVESLETDPGNRYIDFLLPGLMGMNLMGGGLWGIGFVIVDMRVRKLLKRFLATPMRRGDFLLALFTARFFMLIPEMVSLAALGYFVFNVPMRGSPLLVLLFVLLGSGAFSGMGLLIASRTEKIETVSGLMNLVMLPMWLLSGVFFSSKRFPDVVQPFVQALPLTQINDGLREVMLEGKGFSDVAWRLAILAGYAVICFGVALKIFRWK